MFKRPQMVNGLHLNSAFLPIGTQSASHPSTHTGTLFQQHLLVVVVATSQPPRTELYDHIFATWLHDILHAGMMMVTLF